MQHINAQFVEECKQIVPDQNAPLYLAGWPGTVFFFIIVYIIRFLLSKSKHTFSYMSHELAYKF